MWALPETVCILHCAESSQHANQDQHETVRSVYELPATEIPVNMLGSWLIIHTLTVQEQTMKQHKYQVVNSQASKWHRDELRVM